MKQVLYLFILFVGIYLFLPQFAIASSESSCNCAYTLPSDTWKVDGDALNIQPGDLICLEAGSRGSIRLENLHGTAANPIVIKNCGGQVTTTATDYGIKIAHSSYVRLTGTGDPSYKYGIRAGGTVYVGELTTNVEVDHVEVFAAGFASFMVKTDPQCDPATWRENFTMRDVSIHDNYAHNSQNGEGFYIGFTFFDGYTRNCNGIDTTVYGHVIENLEVYNNLTENTGAEGIQIGSSPNASIHDNTVRQYGQRPFANYQNNGMQIGAGTTGKVYNNWIEDGPGNGLIVLSPGELVFYNNVIKDAGASGVFADERSTPSTVSGFDFINNTIINPVGDGITIYADLVPINHIKNNIIVSPGGEYVRKLNNNVNLEMANNLFAATLAEVKFRDPANKDYHLQSDSPAVEAGLDVSSFAITADRTGTIRPYGNAYEIGAYEFLPTLRLQGSPTDQIIDLQWAFDSTLPDGATWRISYNGSGSPASPITGIAKNIRSYQLTNLTNYSNYTITLEAMDGATVLYTDSISLFPTDIHVYLPIILK